MTLSTMIEDFKKPLHAIEQVQIENSARYVLEA